MSKNTITVTIYSLTEPVKEYRNVSSCTMLTQSGVVQILPGHKSMVTAIKNGYVKVITGGDGKTNSEIIKNISAIVKVEPFKVEIFKIVI